PTSLLSRVSTFAPLLWFVRLALLDFRLPLLPVLHSFPTRRSSDLGRPARDLARVPRERGFLDQRRRARDDVRRLRARHPAQRGRSEEHTSELQSRVDLVCRLLLEKKTSVANRLHRP